MKKFILTLFCILVLTPQLILANDQDCIEEKSPFKNLQQNLKPLDAKTPKKVNNSRLRMFARGMNTLARGILRKLIINPHPLLAQFSITPNRIKVRYKNPKDPSEYITRSARLNSTNLRNYASSLESIGLKPAIGQACLNAIENADACKKVECLSSKQVIDQCRQQVAASCTFYSGESRPLFIYLHIHGHSSSSSSHKHSKNDGESIFFARGDYAIQMMHLSKILGFRFLTPFDQEASTLVANHNPLSAGKNPELAPRHSLEKLYLEEKGEGLNCALSSYQSANPSLNRDELYQKAYQSLQKREKENLGKSLGNWENIFALLKLLTDKNNLPASFFCHGGKHKTSILDLMLLALKEDALNKHSYSEKRQYTFGLYKKENGKRSLYDLIHAKKRSGLEAEYYEFNPEEVREDNLEGVHDIVHLVRNPLDEEYEKKVLEKYQGFLSKKDIARMRQEWNKLVLCYQQNLS